MASTESQEFFEHFEDSEDDYEPVATEDEIREYDNCVSKEKEEETRLEERFSGKTIMALWCECSNCSLDMVVKPEECRCCFEFDRCTEKMADQEEPQDNTCITLHPAFRDVCLNKYVLEVAAVGLKTKAKRSYTVLYNEGRTSESQFYRAVSYRQFVRFVWEYIGHSNRVPLPCCVYNAIRKEFPDELGEYCGFEEEEEEGESDDSDQLLQEDI